MGQREGSGFLKQTMTARGKFHFQSSPYKKDLAYASINRRFLWANIFKSEETISHLHLNINFFSYLIRFLPQWLA